jgi:hypothetical protein
LSVHKRYLTVVPAELLQTVDAFSRAIVNNEPAAEHALDESALEAYLAAGQRLAEIRPLTGFEVIARAKIGLQYIVKVRFCGTSGRDLTLQTRWHRSIHAEQWRMVELNDLGIHSPWKKPDKPAMVDVNA